MDRTNTFENDESQYLELSFSERFNSNQLPVLLARFTTDFADHGIVSALTRVSDRLCPREAMELALSALSNAAYGAKLGVRIICSEQAAVLTEYVATILKTTPLPDAHFVDATTLQETSPPPEAPF